MARYKPSKSPFVIVRLPSLEWIDKPLLPHPAYVFFFFPDLIALLIDTFILMR